MIDKKNKALLQLDTGCLSPLKKPVGNIFHNLSIDVQNMLAKSEQIIANISHVDIFTQKEEIVESILMKNRQILEGHDEKHVRELRIRANCQKKKEDEKAIKSWSKFQGNGQAFLARGLLRKMTVEEDELNAKYTEID